jgi:hypothetical protein
MGVALLPLGVVHTVFVGLTDGCIEIFDNGSCARYENVRTPLNGNIMSLLETGILRPFIQTECIVADDPRIGHACIQGALVPLRTRPVRSCRSPILYSSFRLPFTPAWLALSLSHGMYPAYRR